MKTDLQIGNLTAVPGQKITGECSFPVNGDKEGRAAASGVVLFLISSLAINHGDPLLAIDV
jgi:hypothetical protein